MTQHVFLNGSIMPADQAAISPFDIGLLRGYAVFDLLRTIDGRPFLLDEHLVRLRNSAAELNLQVTLSDAEIADAITQLLALNGHGEATVRMVLTGGVSPDGMGFDPATPTFLIMTHELHEPPAEVYERGGKLLTEAHKRQFPMAKTTNYLTMLRHRERISEEGALDLLYHDHERIYEAASASFYVVIDGTIHAPANEVLAGTIGGFVLERAKESHPIVFRDISLEEALAADEAFLTSTTRGVVPIVWLDDHAIGDGTVGPVTKDLIRIFREAAFGTA